MFWARWIELVHQDRPGWSRATRPPKDSWFTMTTGVGGATYSTAFTRQGLSSELVFDSPDPATNSARFEILEAQKERVEETYGAALDWQPLPGRKSARVAEYFGDADVSVREEWDSYLSWLLDRQTRLRDALSAVGGVPDPGPSAAPSPW